MNKRRLKSIINECLDEVIKEYSEADEINKIKKINDLSKTVLDNIKHGKTVDIRDWAEEMFDVSLNLLNMHKNDLER